MSNRSPNHTALRRLTPAEWIARREESIKRISELLAESRLTVFEVAERCGLVRETARGHLVHMEVLGLAHRTGEYGAFNREYWAAGEKPPAAEAPKPADPEEVAECSSRTVPARQEGKTRDPLVAALFGPARGAAA